MTTYTTLKFMHISCVVISVALFSYRFFLLQRYPQKSLSQFFKITPHVNDTLLLSAAIGMLVVLQLNPLRVPWLVVKLALLPVYIGLGAMCLRSEPGSGRQVRYFILAMIVFILIVATATLKSWVFIV